MGEGGQFSTVSPLKTYSMPNKLSFHVLQLNLEGYVEHFSRKMHFLQKMEAQNFVFEVSKF